MIVIIAGALQAEDADGGVVRRSDPELRRRRPAGLGQGTQARPYLPVPPGDLSSRTGG